MAVGISNVDFAGQTQEGGDSLSGNESVTMVSKTYTPGDTTPPNGDFGTDDAQHIILVVDATGSRRAKN